MTRDEEIDQIVMEMREKRRMLRARMAAAEERKRDALWKLVPLFDEVPPELRRYLSSPNPFASEPKLPSAS